MAHSYKERKYDYTPDEARILVVFIAINIFVRKHGYSPSIREIDSYVEFNSTSYTLDCIKKLVERGWIVRSGKPGTARDIAVTSSGKEAYAEIKERSGVREAVRRRVEALVREAASEVLGEPV